ncbi:RNA polymerase sigma factor [Lutimonas saemankumensis]|nr:RNA polymerase sigma factor [Lutimonas saemankumensis]
MLRIIKTNSNSELIRQSLQNNRRAQKMLYEKYSPKMLSLCAYYIKDLQKSEEVMLSGFLKVFTKLHQYSQKGSFEGWVRKIMVYECISYLRKKNTLLFTDEIEFYESVVENEIELKIAIEDLQIFINKLPEGCKIIFNMYVIEGYKHTEIADMLNISVGTCKTQLHRARKALQDMISHHQKKKIL